MPVEAVHLSGLVDSLAMSSAWVRRATSGPYHRAARLGALFVDLPYFDRFSLAVARYALRQPQALSRWGHVFHQNTPIALGRLLGECGHALTHKTATREAGETLTALSLGYISHAALDTAMHPHINRLARERAERTGLDPSVEHQEIEKFHSLLFHEQRFGQDPMGTQKMRVYIEVDGRCLGEDGPVADAVQGALRSLHGQAPTRQEFRRYARGYLSYARLIGNAIVGPRIGPPAAREAARLEVFTQFDFLGRFSEAVAKSRQYLDALGAYLADGLFDESARVALARLVPEGSIDPDPTS